MSVQRDLYSVADLLNLLRALALNADPATEDGRGYLRALLSLAVAIGAPTEDVIPQPVTPRVMVISSHRLNGR